MRVSDKLKKVMRAETPYQRIARLEGVSVTYVGMIARAERAPVRGKGLKVYNRLKELTSETSN